MEYYGNVTVIIMDVHKERCALKFLFIFFIPFLYVTSIDIWIESRYDQTTITGQTNRNMFNFEWTIRVVEGGCKETLNSALQFFAINFCVSIIQTSNQQSIKSLSALPKDEILANFAFFCVVTIL